MISILFFALDLTDFKNIVTVDDTVNPRTNVPNRVNAHLLGFHAILNAPPPTSNLS